MYDKIKYWYINDMWDEKNVLDAVEKGIITEEEAKEILASKE